MLLINFYFDTFRRIFQGERVFRRSRVTFPYSSPNYLGSRKLFLFYKLLQYVS